MHIKLIFHKLRNYHMVDTLERNRENMEVTYRRNLHKSYMCIQEQEEDKEAYELHMLKNVRVPYLLRMEIIVTEGRKQYWYDISGKQQLEDYLSGKKMDYGILWNLLYTIRELCFVLPEYLLRENGICLVSEYIYINLENEGLYFTYLPFWNQNLPEAFEHYMEQILRKIDHQDSAATELGYQVYQRCMVKNADIQGILQSVIKKEKTDQPEKEIIKTIDTELEEISYGDVEEEKKYFDFSKYCLKKAPWIFEFLSNFREKNLEEENKKENSVKENSLKEKVLKKKFLRKRHLTEIPKKKVAEKEEFTEGKEEFTAGKEPIHPTEILGVCSQELKGKLIYQGMHNCEDIWVEGETFLLGKNRQQANGIIEAEGISRLHARISRQEGIYYLEDLNSTNGTYLNGEPVEYHQKKKLCKGDYIQFAAEEFLFS